MEVRKHLTVLNKITQQLIFYNGNSIAYNKYNIKGKVRLGKEKV